MAQRFFFCTVNRCHENVSGYSVVDAVVPVLPDLYAVNRHAQGRTRDAGKKNNEFTTQGEDDG